MDSQVFPRLLAAVPQPLATALIAALVGTAISVAAIAAACRAPRINWAARVTAIVTFTPVALFCVWGFAAAMEPGDYHAFWRVVYGAVFLSCLPAIGRLAFTKRVNPPSAETPE